jgi:antagonist of KipI
MIMSIDVLHPGAFTTIQDLGRPRGRSMGLSVGGAADSLALRVANWLVGNDESAAAIECRLVGPQLRFAHETRVAICGARAQGFPHWQSLVVRAGELLDLSHLDDGVYAYLAVAGGIDVPAVLDSRSTDTRIVLGGFNGRALQKGDHLSPSPSYSGERGKCRVHFESWYGGSPIRVIRGEQWDEFSRSLVDGTFDVSSKSDRMGVRLSGVPLLRTQPSELPSGPVTPGTIQVPPDGNPIVLLADAQTLGGYPKIAHVISVDLPRVSQIRAGATIQFTEVSLDEAHDLHRRRTKELAMLKYAIREKLQ